jgi:phosphate transport system protein
MRTMTTADLSDHTSRRFNKDLEELRNSVLSMGGLVETQLSRAIAAIVSGDSELGLEVAGDDYKVNRMEVEIDEECSRILATRAPAAGDLRLIVAIFKTITDLERVGDEAEKIGFLASRLAAMDRPADSYRELKNLGNHVLQMLRDAMNAFARLDVPACRAVLREDERVDEEYDAISRQCITFMMEDPRNIKRSMNVTWAARALERIGDHAKNICEYVIYMVEGQDIRHTDLDAADDVPAS